MAKKGGVQQLQADLQTDDEFDRFIERPGLIVCDIYSEWCGPCLGMVGSLKKIKLELGGDNLHLAIGKSDTISYFNRFNKKSEPTWLFIVDKQAVNLMFGTNVPKLMKLITNELSYLTTKTPRTTYGITELQPEELQRKKILDEAADEAIRIEKEEIESKRKAYLHEVTDSIIDNLGDIGVSVFGLQVARDMFKKINEPAENLKLQCKDRKVAPVTRENFELVNLVCTNPLPEDVLDQLDQRELLLCYWKMPEDSQRTVVDLMNLYAQNLENGRVDPPEVPGGNPTEHPPVITPMDIQLEIELDEYEEPEIEQPNTNSLSKPDDLDVLLTEVGGGENGEEAAEALGQGLDLGLAFGIDRMLGDDEFNIDSLVEAPPPPPKKRIEIKTITIPPIWVPNSQRAHAALVYTFFRNQTVSFLPPDPVPDPPHVVMAFDAYKKKDLLETYQRHRDNVPVFGFFTSDEVNEAQLIARTVEEYSKKVPNPTDKIIFRINKTTSATMLAFAPFGPSYVSGNTVVGMKEARKLFPEDYNTVEETKDDDVSKKKKKKDKSKKDDRKDDKKVRTSTTSMSPSTVTGGDEGATGSTEILSTEGGTPTTSGEESSDSMQQAAVPADGDSAIDEVELQSTDAPVEQSSATAIDTADTTSEVAPPASESDTIAPELKP